jgi:hypothetical protein
MAADGCAKVEKPLRRGIFFTKKPPLGLPPLFLPVEGRSSKYFILAKPKMGRVNFFVSLRSFSEHLPPCGTGEKQGMSAEHPQFRHTNPPSERIRFPLLSFNLRLSAD